MSSSPAEGFVTLVSKMDDVYETLRVRSLCVRHRAKWISIGTQISLLPFSMPRGVQSTYPGNYLRGFESHLPFISTLQVVESVKSGILQLDNTEIVLGKKLESDTSWNFWPVSKTEEKEGIKYDYNGFYLGAYFANPSDDDFPDKNRLDIETRLNPRARFETIEDLSKMFLGRPLNMNRAPMTHIEALSWTRIEQAEFSGDHIGIAFVSPFALMDRVKLRVAFILPDGRVRIHSLRLRQPVIKQIQNSFVEVRKSVEIPSWARQAGAANLTASLEDHFALDNLMLQNTHELNPTFHLLKSFDETELRARTFGKWIRGVADTGRREMDHFEYAVSNLFTSLGFLTILPGPLGLEGIDVVAYLPKRRLALVLECSSAKVSKKAAGCLRAVTRLKRAIPSTTFVGITVTSGLAASVERAQLETDELKVIDSRDLDVLCDLAHGMQDTDKVLQALGM